MNKADKHIAKYAKRYHTFTHAAYGHRKVKECLLFAFLSVNTAYETNARAWRAMKGKDWTDETETMHELMKHGIHYANARAKYIVEAYHQLATRPVDFIWNVNHETVNEYRNRLVRDIKGLSWIKVSFFISLLYGNSAHVCCLDRWMLRALGFTSPEKAMRTIGTFRPGCRKTYETLEAKLSKRAKSLNLSLCAYQWALWDYTQWKHMAETAFPTEPKFKSNPMRVLWTPKHKRSK